MTWCGPDPMFIGSFMTLIPSLLVGAMLTWFLLASAFLGSFITFQSFGSTDLSLLCKHVAIGPHGSLLRSRKTTSFLKLGFGSSLPPFNTEAAPHTHTHPCGTGFDSKANEFKCHWFTGRQEPVTLSGFNLPITAQPGYELSLGGQSCPICSEEDQDITL